ncbi:DUF1177 domain-containing protein [Microbacterium esteraromaticum]|uniref:DUF1177 domain-containing protein n=1 Tax=Microbacterium esteraromaticum TaxID=57043 RepID=A0A7D8AK49_9MICO|nr:DUF1177 domain-containing protein [Microbacterium esteraromaticum]QMU97526.1 DUF1177 domain-containing protein [Microbacterium esteraromaticum]
MLTQVLDVVDLLDSPQTSGESLAAYLRAQGAEGAEIHVETITGDDGSTDFVRVVIPGSAGKRSGGSAPTLGVIGRLGGAGARPERIGFVSDGDGAAAALSAAAKLLQMKARGDELPGDVIVTTHVTGWAPTEPHDPVPFMGSPVDMGTMNEHEVTDEMDAIVSIDTTKGNRTINHRGIAISPTVKEGYILRPSEDLVGIAESVTGVSAVVFPLATQDITPYGNDLHHLNSILQPAVATSAPVVGVAITTAVPVAGCATGASHEVDIELAARFAVETAKYYGAGQVAFHDEEQFAHLVELYGTAHHLQTLGRKAD